MVSHNGSPPSVRSSQAGHARLKIGAARISVTMLIGTSRVDRSGERELGRKVFSSWKTKHNKLLFSSSEVALRRPPVMLCRSSPEKESTVPVLPPMLHTVC